MNATWIWGALGLVLIEMATGTFYVLWFGIAARYVSVAMLVFLDMLQTIQFVMFAALSIGSFAIWKLINNLEHAVYG